MNQQTFLDRLEKLAWEKFVARLELASPSLSAEDITRIRLIAMGEACLDMMKQIREEGL